MPNATTNVRSNSSSSGVAARCPSAGSRPDIGARRWTSGEAMGGKYPGEKRETWPWVEPADNTEAPVGPRRDRVLGRYVTSHLDGRQVSRVVYGSIIGLALVVGLEAHPPGAGAVIATLLGTGLAVGLAELYSELV